jgi:hypothetical protein
MAGPRAPRERARLTGYDIKHPERFRLAAAASIVEAPVGDPPGWLTDYGKEAWRELADVIPWLDHSHRGIVGITAHLAGRLRSDPDVPPSVLNLLRLCLGQLGATPADRGKVSWSEPAEDDPGASSLDRYTPSRSFCFQGSLSDLDSEGTI